MEIFSSSQTTPIQYLESHREGCIFTVETLACALLVIGILGLLAANGVRLPGMQTIGIGSSISFITIGSLLALSPLLFLCRSNRENVFLNREHVNHSERVRLAQLHYPPETTGRAYWDTKNFPLTPPKTKQKEDPAFSGVPYVSTKEHISINFLDSGVEWKNWPLYLGYKTEHYLLTPLTTAFLLKGEDGKEYAVLANLAVAKGKTMKTAWVASGQPKELPPSHSVEDVKSLFKGNKYLCSWWSLRLEQFDEGLCYQHFGGILAKIHIDPKSGHPYIEDTNGQPLRLLTPDFCILKGKVTERQIEGSNSHKLSVRTRKAYSVVNETQTEISVIIEKPTPIY